MWHLGEPKQMRRLYFNDVIKSGSEEKLN